MFFLTQSPGFVCVCLVSGSGAVRDGVGGTWCCATSRKVAASIPFGFIKTFHWLNNTDRAMDLGVDSASNRNEYQVHFLWGVKAAGA
jgi:hypothetical protein